MLRYTKNLNSKVIIFRRSFEICRYVGRFTHLVITKSYGQWSFYLKTQLLKLLQTLTFLFYSFVDFFFFFFFFFQWILFFGLDIIIFWWRWVLLHRFYNSSIETHLPLITFFFFFFFFLMIFPPKI